MTARVPTQTLYVDHVLGWAAPLRGADTAGDRDPRNDGRTVASRDRALEQRTRTGDKTEDGR
jgi:hypothetical protein